MKKLSRILAVSSLFALACTSVYANNNICGDNKPRIVSPGSTQTIKPGETVFFKVVNKPDQPYTVNFKVEPGNAKSFVYILNRNINQDSINGSSKACTVLKSKSLDFSKRMVTENTSFSSCNVKSSSFSDVKSSGVCFTVTKDGDKDASVTLTSAAASKASK